MKITYDREVDALHIRFVETTVTTKHLAEGIAADYDADGHLAGIEILDAVKRLGDQTVLKQIILEDVALGRPSAATIVVGKYCNQWLAYFPEFLSRVGVDIAPIAPMTTLGTVNRLDRILSLRYPPATFGSGTGKCDFRN